MRSKRISILPIGDVKTEHFLTLALLLSVRFKKISVLDRVPLPRDSFDTARRQHDSAAFLAAAEEGTGEKVLGVTDEDLFAEGLNFVFGRAILGGRACVISTARLAEDDPVVFRSRMVKEAVHELGHTFGLGHCQDRRCVMRFSNSILDTDKKGTWFCGSCRTMLESLESG